jgi:hypothetical protein
LVQKPPEFEPSFLHIKWQDQMVRRTKDAAQEVEPRD